jgi:ABC-type polysaccharide/polyol phosphate transport system ATPase subunit
MQNAIEVIHLSKKFKVYENIYVDRLKEIAFFWQRQKYYKQFTALDDINLTIEKGEVVGLIGPNGAGKTTFLKLLAKISYPTSGQLKTNGSLVAVLALGLGFNPRFTGRENILVGGTLLGMSLAEIKEKEQWIIEFSELKDFIDKPIRTYSSGMYARLSFSVAAAVSPEILIIDEALATGDAFFVQKSLGRIHEICNLGTTAVFVSHNLQQIQRLCSKRVLLMEKGKIANDAPAIEIIKQYDEMLYQYREKEALRTRAQREGVDSDVIRREKNYFGNGKVVIQRVYFTDAAGADIVAANTGDEVTLHIEYSAKANIADVQLLVHFENYAGFCAYGFNSKSYFDAGKSQLIEWMLDFKQGSGIITIKFAPILFTTNKYFVSMTLYEAKKLLDGKADYLDSTIYSKKHMIEFNVFKPQDLATDLFFEHPVTVNTISSET